MAISLDTATTQRHPTIKKREPGQYVDVAIVNVAEIPRRDYKTGEQKLSRSGKPQTQDVITGVVVGGNAYVSENDADRLAAVGELVTIFVAGRDRWDKDGDAPLDKGAPKSWSGAKTDHGGLSVGDVLRWKYEREQPGQGTQPRKVCTFKLRAPRSDELELVGRCEQLHRDQTAISLDGGGDTQSQPWDDEEPF